MRTLEAQLSAAFGIDIRTWIWFHPEWPIIAISAACWAVMLFSGHTVHHLPVILGWILMVGGMMLPMQIAEVRHIAFHSKFATRQASVLLFLISYMFVWAIAATPLLFVQEFANGGDYYPSMLFLFSAALSQTSTFRTITWKAHGSQPIYTTGWPWLSSISTIGLRKGFLCLLTCLPAMYACALSHHYYPAMILGFLAAYVMRSRLTVPRKTIGGIYIICSILVWPM